MKSLVLCLLLFSSKGLTQQTCQGGYTEYILNANHIRASFFPRGNKFNSGMTGGFQVPYSSGKHQSTMFASSPWIAGFDDAGNLKSTTETYGPAGDVYYAVGPLTSIGTPFPDSICKHFDRAWTVFAEDIIRHRMDYEQDFRLDDTITSIFKWPGNGSTTSLRFNGFELPFVGVQGLAPFVDFNSNGKYDPENGDYPDLLPKSTSEPTPSQMTWMVFNDLLPKEPPWIRRPLRFEIQLTAYAFYCEDHELLNNTIFNRYRFINRGITPIDSLLFGMWTDYDLGCGLDDFVGSDSLRSSEFVYNADVVDGDIGTDCSAGASTYSDQIPPVMSLTYLTPKMHSFIMYSGSADSPVEQYRLLNGEWEDGSPMRPAGDGYNEDAGLSTTRYMFNGDPRDKNSWSAINIMDQGSDVKTVSSVSLPRMNPGMATEVYMAYTFHYDSMADHVGQIGFMQHQLDSLLTYFAWDNSCINSDLCLDDNCVWPGDFNHNGRVDHEDYLVWGVFNTHVGPNRNGLINWRGHNAQDWNHTWEDINAKHADGNGDGVVDMQDIEVHRLNLFLENDDYIATSYYPLGNDLLLSADQGYIDSITNIQVRSSRYFENVLGISFEIEFDTAFFELVGMQSFYPDVPDILRYESQANKNGFYPYAFVETNQESIFIENGFTFCGSSFNGLQLRPGKSAPDSTIIRLRNLKGIDPEGNELHLGSLPLTICRGGFVCSPQPNVPRTVMHPNPAGDEFYIINTEETECILYDVNGRILIRKTVAGPGDSIQVSHLPQGFYIVRVGSTGETLKLIIQ